MRANERLPRARNESAVTAITPDPPGYANLLQDVTDRVATARVRAALSVNRELVLLYWSIGEDILQRQRAEGWGARVIDRLSSDLRRVFPEMKGLSARSLKYMRAFAEAWPDRRIVQQLAAQLPWGHSMALLDSVKARDEREWYAQQTLEHGWSRAIMLHPAVPGAPAHASLAAYR